MKLNELRVNGHEDGHLIVLHETPKGKRLYRVERDEDGEVVDVRTRVVKTHGKGHTVDYWKRVRTGSAPRQVLTEFAENQDE